MHYSLLSRKTQTKSVDGWFSFFVVSIMVQIDTRQRGGLIANADEGVSFRCHQLWL